MVSVTQTHAKWPGYLLWVVAIIIALISSVYQRMTGPTYPLKGSIDIQGTAVEFKLKRSEVVSQDVVISLDVPDESITGYVTFRRYKSYDELTIIHLQRKNYVLETSLPRQPPAGKLMYSVYLVRNGKSVSLSGDEPVILRYKGFVPSYFLLPHILFMLLAMITSNRAALEVLFHRTRSYKYMMITIVSFFVGGLLFGPIVQKYAFGDFWTGIPFGTDLTDNKTIIAFMGWMFAWVMNSRGKRQPGWILGASILMLIIYLIPHSLFGSELDYTKIK